MRVPNGPTSGRKWVGRGIAAAGRILSAAVCALALAAWAYGPPGRERIGQWSVRRDGPWLTQRFAGVFPDDGGVFVGRVEERLFEEKYLQRGETSMSDFDRREWFRSYTGWIGDVPVWLKERGLIRPRPELAGFTWDAWDGFPIGSALAGSEWVLETRGWRLVRVPYWFLAVAGALWPGIWVVGRVRRIVAAERLRRARERGVCPGCGYDLRASGERCPECGRDVGV
jgi:hypothetical protein